MLGPRWRRVLLATLVAVAALGAGSGLRETASHAASQGVVVFASDRAKSNPGEIYSLAPGTAPRNISRSLAAEHDLAVAAHGDLIAFWSNRTGFDRVYLARSDGNRVRLVRGIGEGQTSTDQGTGGPLAFSADGSLLVAVFFTGIDASHDFAIDLRTARARPLPPACGFEIAPSPDGRLVACSRGRSRGTRVYDVSGHVRFTLPIALPIWSNKGWLTGRPMSGKVLPGGFVPVVDESGRRIGRVPGLPVAWSPDGNLVLFARGESLLVGDPRGAAPTRLLLSKWSAGGVSFSPDGGYVSTTDARGERLLIPVAGGPPAKGLDAGSGAWSRGGRLAYFGPVAASPARPGITIPVMITDAHGRNGRVVARFPFDDHALNQLHWLPDGRRVLLLTANSCNGDDLFTVPAGGGATRQLTHDPRNLAEPAWSPDGGRIAYTASDFRCHLGEGGPIHLETVRADGGGAQRVTDDGPGNEGSFDGDPTFSPDGTQLAFGHGTFDMGSLQMAPAGGGARSTLVPPGSPFPGSPAWSPDGSIAYVHGDEIDAIAPGGSPVVLAPNPVGSADTCGNGGLAWSRDGKELALGGGQGIYVITLGQPVSAQPAISVPCAEYPSFSPDDTQIAFDAAPPNPLGGQSAIMVADIDGANVHVLSTVPFRESVHPSWQPAQ